MKNLPEIGSKVETINNIKVKIVAHYEDKAVFIFKNIDGFIRADMAVASFFKEIEPAKPEQAGCASGKHNYVQVHEAHSNKAFCTRCGSTISLE